jgi:hypothetical protein
MSGKEGLSSQLSAYLKKKHGVQEPEGAEQEDFQTVLRAPGGTETAQENIQDWLDLDKGGPIFQLLTEEEIAVVIFSIYVHQH